MRYFTKVGLFGKKSSDLTDSIFDGPLVLAGIGSGKVGIKAQGESYRLVFREGFVVIEGLGMQGIRCNMINFKFAQYLYKNKEKK